MIENKKASIVLILKILQEYSDEDHFLTQQDIIDKIYQEYGIELERKSVAFSLSLLQELDYDINKSPRGGYALLSRDFDVSEVRYMTDALFSSKSINGKQAVELSKKLNACLSKYQRKSFDFIYKGNEINRQDNKELFYTLELIEEAKRRGKRVSFEYLTFDKQGKAKSRMDGFRYIVSPYYSVSNNGRYYLICNYREKYKPISVFRLDYMVKPKIEETWPIKPIDTLKDLKKKFDIVEYLNNNLYLLDGEVINAEIEILNEESVQYVVDYFGKNARVREKDGKIVAYIKCNEKALFYWYMQYSEVMTILAPKSLINKVKEEAKNIINKYK